MKKEWSVYCWSDGDPLSFFGPFTRDELRQWLSEQFAEEQGIVEVRISRPQPKAEAQG